MRYNTFDLLSKISALRLLPSNCAHAMRLDALSNLVASQAADGGLTITPSELHKLVNDSQLGASAFAMAEDPATLPLCEEISFTGGGYRIFPGAFDGVGCGTRIFLHSVFHPEHQYLPSSVLKDLFSMSWFTLAASERVASHAGIRRNTPSVQSDAILVPNTGVLDELRRSLVFERDEFRRLTEECGLRRELEDQLSCEIGDVKFESFLQDYNKTDLIYRPFIKMDRQVLLSDPSVLMICLMEHSLKMIRKADQVGSFARELRRKSWGVTSECMKWLNMTPVDGVGINEDLDNSFILGGFGFDSDKVVVVCLMTDDLSEQGRSRKIGKPDKLYRHLKEFCDMLLSSRHPPNELMFLFIASHFLEPTLFEFCKPPYDFKALILNLYDLESISRLENGNNLFLYKYALAQESVRKSTEIFSLDALNEYGFFRSHGYSYYISDDRRPDALTLVGDFAAGVRQEALEKYDQHSVHDLTGKRILEVIRLHEDSPPLYVEASIPLKIEILLEGLMLPIWFTCRSKRVHGTPRKVSIETIEMLSYWLYEMRETVNTLLNNLIGSQSQIVFELNIDQDASWGSLESDNGSAGTDADFRCILDADGKIQIDLPPSIIHRMSGATNEGEIFAMQRVTTSLIQLANARLSTKRYDDSVAEVMVKKHMPLGAKKKISTIYTMVSPELDPTGMQQPMLIDEMDVNRILDEIGEYARRSGLRVGDNQKKQAEFVNHIVSHLFDLLKKEVSVFDAAELFEALIAQNESLIHGKALIEHQIPMFLELQGKEKANKMFEERSREITKASIASRFLIEYAFAQPPRGIRQMSEAAMDGILALAEQIVNWGFTSDLLYYGLGNMKISLLPSGRVGTTHDTFEKALAMFSGQYYPGLSDRLSARFSTKWNPQKRDEENVNENQKVSFDRLDVGLLEEYGFTLRDYGELVRCLSSSSSDPEETIFRVRFEEVVNLLEHNTKIQSDRIPMLIENLSIGPRIDFFGHPSFPNRYEYFPWRFNRELSYIRRPLLIEKDNNIVYVRFGMRMLWSALDNFISLLGSGRLQSRVRSRVLQEAITEMKEPVGRRFNQEVAGLFRAKAGMLVDSNVKRFGKVKMEFVKGQELGDIDVLAIDSARRVIHVIECKDLVVARTPYELYHELKKVFGGPKSHSSMFLKRVEWVRQNLDVVLWHYQIEKKDGWEVKSEIVVDEPLMSSHFSADPAIKIVMAGEIALL